MTDFLRRIKGRGEERRKGPGDVKRTKHRTDIQEVEEHFLGQAQKGCTLQRRG